MVAEQIAARGVSNPAVLRAMEKVPRHEFVPPGERSRAYDDRPLPIGHRQTISQPYIVAFMTEVAAPRRTDRFLEIGTGSGYQAAVLAELAGEVYSIEIIPDLGREAEVRLRRLGYDRIKLRVGDGYLGWPEVAPFDGILVTAGADHVPEPLYRQLERGGRMLIPVRQGDGEWLKVVEKTAAGERRERPLIPVRFVPLVRSN